MRPGIPGDDDGHGRGDGHGHGHGHGHVHGHGHCVDDSIHCNVACWGKKSSAASIINAHSHQRQCHRHHFEGYTWNEMDPLSSLSKIWNTRSTKKGWGENINHTALPLTRMSTAIKRMLT